MVRLPTLGSRVRAAVVPAVRAPTSVDPAAFGAAGAAGIGQVGNALGNIAVQEKKKKQQVDVTAAIAQAEAFKTDLMYGPNGYAKLKGQDRMKESQAVQAKYTGALQQVRAGLDEDAALMFDQVYGIEASTRMGREVAQMHLEAVQDYEDMSRKNARAGLLNSAFAQMSNGTMTPQSFDELLNTGVAIEVLYADRQGQDRQGQKAAALAFVSDLHETQLEALLASQKDVLAVAYFEKNKNGMLADARDRMQRRVYDVSQEGLVETVATGFVDRGLKEGGATSGEQEAFAASLVEQLPAEQRRAVGARVQEKFYDRRRRETQTRNDMFNVVANSVLKKGANLRTVMGMREWELLDGPQQADIETAIANRNKPGPATSNAEVMERLTHRFLTSDPTFLDVNAQQLVASRQLTPEDATLIEKWQKSLVKEKGGDGKDADSYRTRLGIVEDWLAKSKITTATAAANFRIAVMRAEAAAPPMTDAEFETMVQRLAIKVSIDKPGIFTGSWGPRLGDLDAEGLAALSEDLDEINYADIPKRDVDEATAMLKAAGEEASQRNVKLWLVGRMQRQALGQR